VKKFSFPLGRVLNWRVLQAQIEESKLERLYAELRAIHSSEAALERERIEAERAVLAGASGADLSALDSFRRFTVSEHTRIEKLRSDCAKRIAAQIQIVAAKRRDVKLLDRLREQRRAVWTRELHRELDAQADESFLARFTASRS
jgi:hypothetical protein